MSSENPDGASEEGKNCSLHFSFLEFLHPMKQVAVRKGERWATSRMEKSQEKQRLNRVGATPLFGGESAQKFHGVTPTLHGR